jgi:hypothetical protein
VQAAIPDPVSEPPSRRSTFTVKRYFVPDIPEIQPSWSDLWFVLKYKRNGEGMQLASTADAYQTCRRYMLTLIVMSAVARPSC